MCVGRVQVIKYTGLQMEWKNTSIAFYLHLALGEILKHNSKPKTPLK